MTLAPEALVVDASVAAKWYLQDEQDADRALLLFSRFTASQVDLFAPAYRRVEIPAVITHATLTTPPRVTQMVAREEIATFLELDIEALESPELMLAAFDGVHQHGIALYDSLYLSLAQRLAIPFITADRRLYERIRHLTDVIWLGDYN